MKKLFQNKKFKYTLLGIIVVCIVFLGITYAYWLLTKEQTNKNVITTSCLKVDFSGENDITLDEAYPMKEDELEYFLTNQKPYHFTITNKCNNLQNAVINLETLNVSNTLLEDDYIDVLLYEDDYNNLNRSKNLTGNTINDSNKVIKDARHAYALYNFTLKNNETREFNLQIYLDKDTPMNENTMNASWKGKITLSTEYTNDKFINAGTLRTISSSDSNGMWKYKTNIKQIVIEDSKNRKTSDDGVVYGPFDESATQDNSVQSYVVCESGDTNCVGYLQGDGGVKANPNSSYLFNGYSKVNEINGLENLKTSEVTNMSSMFSSCSSIQNLDLSSFDMTNVNSAGSMFNGMSQLRELNLSNWKFNDNITNYFTSTTSLRFDTQLENLILNNVDTSNVTTMDNMFGSLSFTNKLTTLDLSDFDTSNVNSMFSLFDGSTSLTNLDLSSFDTKKVESVNYLFRGCTNLADLNLSGWDLSNSSYNADSGLFDNCKNLKSLNMTNFVFPENSSAFFANLTNLNNLVLNGSDTSHVVNMSGMFSDCSNLTELDLISFDTGEVTNISNMFSGTEKIKALDLSNFKTNKITSIGGIFNQMNSLQTLDLSNWIFNDKISNGFSITTGLYNNYAMPLNAIILNNVNTSNVTNFANMFNGLRNVTSLDLSAFDTSNIVNISNMFYEMNNLQELNLNNWAFNDEITEQFSINAGLTSTKLANISLKNVNTSQVTDMDFMFSNFYNLTTLDLSSFDTTNINSLNYVFSGSDNLTELNLSNWDLSKVDSIGIFKTFGQRLSLNEINMTNFVFPKDCNNFFLDVNSLSNIILDNVNTSNVINMNAMFANCNNLISLDLSSFNTQNVTNFIGMFNNTPNLHDIKFGQNFVHSSGALTDGMFTNCASPNRPSNSSWQGVSFD